MGAFYLRAFLLTEGKVLGNMLNNIPNIVIL